MGGNFAHPRQTNESDWYGSGWTGLEKPQSGERAVHAACVPLEKMGVYRVSADITDARAVFGTRRNLMALNAKAGHVEFLTTITEYYPMFASAPRTDARAFLSIAGGEITNMRAEPAEARRVFIAGDSTVADQQSDAAYYPFDSYCGWGQMLSLFLPNDAVCNQAHSGMTARSFVLDGHFDIVKAHMRPGDLLLIQFGHNDQKRRALQADAEYPLWLTRLCEEACALGGTPVLVSPLSRVPSHDAGGTFDALTDHAEAVKSLAARMNVPFIDLHTYSFDFLTPLGENARRYFRPGDATHSNDYGAYKWAKFIAQELKNAGLAAPVFPNLSFSPDDDDTRPEPRPAVPAQPLPVPYRDIADVEDFSVVHDGVQRGLLDPCVLYMQPHLPLPRAQFIQMLFRVARIPSLSTDGQSPYADIKPREFDAPYAMRCRADHLVDGPLYRPDDSITRAEAEDLCARVHYPADFSRACEIPTRFELVRGLLRTKE